MKQRRVIHEVIGKTKDYFDPKKLTAREVVRRVLLLACIVAFFWSGNIVVRKWYDDYVTEMNYKNLRNDNIGNNDQSDIFKPGEEDSGSFMFPEEEPQIVTASYSKYIEESEGDGDLLTDSGRIIGSEHFSNIAINQDVVGYIYIPDTNVNYPVLQYRLDNDYYLARTIDLKLKRAASIFMDFRNRPYGEDLNTVIYGHNMRSGAMFRTLHNYKERSFAIAHNKIYYSTIYEDMVWQVFATYIADLEEDRKKYNYIQTSFTNDEEYEKFIGYCLDKSDYNYGITPEVHDRILTLSTCDGAETERYVVQAVLISRTKR